MENVITSRPLDILFINPPSAFEAYDSTKVRVFRQVFPLLSFMSLSAIAKQRGFTTAVLDLGIEDDPYNLLQKNLAELSPRFVGITSTTPLFFEVAEISRITRKILGSNVKIIYGGPHATALPEESLNQSEIDIVVLGESELTFRELLEERELAEINGICYKKEGKILSTPPRQFIDNLDLLPWPDIDVYDIKRYHCSELVSRGTPVLHMETSRGCPNSCKFCNKNIFLRKFRMKSPERVIEEMKYFIKHGVGEFRIIDDQFATDILRAKIICELMIKEGLDIPWNLANGIRVDKVDQEFLNLAKRAGCYQIGIGFESGDQDSLNSINKGITLEQSIKCMEMVRKSGIESIGFFILGLPLDTEERIERTIKFASKLMPTFAKATILIPFPGTQIFDEYEKEGRIKTRDWSKYNIHKVADIYEHPCLSQKQLRKYYNLFYRRFYLNPKFIFTRLLKSLRERTFWRDIYYGLRTFLPDFVAAVKNKMNSVPKPLL